MNDKEFSDKIHLLVHSLRLMPKYNPSEAEKRISQWVIEKYSSECSECKLRGEQIKNTPIKQGFFSNLKEVLKDA